MAEVNLTAGAYTTINFQLPDGQLADLSTDRIIVETGAGEAAYIPGIYATNPDTGTWSVTVKVMTGSTVLMYVCQKFQLKGGGKPGNTENVLRGAPLYLPENCTVKIRADEYIGTSGSGTGAKIGAAWAKIT